MESKKKSLEKLEEVSCSFPCHKVAELHANYHSQNVFWAPSVNFQLWSKHMITAHQFKPNNKNKTN